MAQGEVVVIVAAVEGKVVMGGEKEDCTNRFCQASETDGEMVALDYASYMEVLVPDFVAARVHNCIYQEEDQDPDQHRSYDRLDQDFAEAVLDAMGDSSSSLSATHSQLLQFLRQTLVDTAQLQASRRRDSREAQTQPKLG